jgi:hypothetical protein
MDENMMIRTLVQIEHERYAYKAGDRGALGFDMDQFYSACCSTACLAGHAAVVGGWQLWNSITAVKGGGEEPRYCEIEDVGREVLGLTPDEAQEVFYLENLDAVYDWVADEMGVSEQVLRDKVKMEVG